ncbi:MAG TPA: DUF2924 domain-containing protein [Silvibacterium sp.]|nr:DUF2924 domain-containing protein [Silvibacterium sp.]
MPDTLAEEIAELPRLNRAQLRAKWRSVLKKEPPAHLRKQLLIPLLAYKMQEQAYGGLGPEIKRRLRELAASFESASSQAGARHDSRRRIKPGTRLIRQWQDKTHHVTVGEDGFEYNGHKYSSLSKIARLITGTRWSGPLFFGIKRKLKKQGGQ